MSRPVALVFPGQGAHDPAMLNQVKHSPRFSERLEIVSHILEVSQKCLLEEMSADYVRENKVSSLLTVLVSLCILDQYREEHGDDNIVALAGYSVGQWTALHAANVLDEQSLLSIVAYRADMMDQCVSTSPSGMSAIIGLSLQDVEDACSLVRSKGGQVWLSNDNAPGSTTASGLVSSLTVLENELAKLEPKIIQRLHVSGAWHSPLLAKAEQAFSDYLNGVQLEPFESPVMNNVGGQLLPKEERELKRELSKHLTHRVAWQQTVLNLIELGAELFYEVGYGNVLSQFGFFINRKVQHKPLAPARRR